MDGIRQRSMVKGKRTHDRMFANKVVLLETDSGTPAKAFRR